MECLGVAPRDCWRSARATDTLYDPYHGIKRTCGVFRVAFGVVDHVRLTVARQASRRDLLQQPVKAQRGVAQLYSIEIDRSVPSILSTNPIIVGRGVVVWLDPHSTNAPPSDHSETASASMIFQRTKTYNLSASSSSIFRLPYNNLTAEASQHRLSSFLPSCIFVPDLQAMPDIPKRMAPTHPLGSRLNRPIKHPTCCDVWFGSLSGNRRQGCATLPGVGLVSLGAS